MKSRPSGPTVANSLVNDSVIKASLLRKRLGSRRPAGSIDLPYALSPSGGDYPATGRRERSENRFALGISGKFRMTGPSGAILCKIAHITPRLSAAL